MWVPTGLTTVAGGEQCAFLPDGRVNLPAGIRVYEISVVQIGDYVLYTYLDYS